MATGTGPSNHLRTPQVRTNDRALIIFAATLVLPTIALLGTYVVRQHTALLASGWELLAWTAALALLNLMPIATWQGEVLAPAEPVALAMCVLFAPPTAALLTFLGFFDRGEFGSKRMALVGLLNRSHTAIGIFLASTVLHQLVGTRSPTGIGFAVALAGVISAVENHLAVAFGTSIYRGTAFREAISRLHVGRPTDYGITVLAWWLLATLLVLVYDGQGLWTLALFVILAVLARQMLARSDSLTHTQQELDNERLVVSALSDRIASERRDERLRVAGDIHDEAIQPLFQVSLLGRVAKHDLSTGRLNDLDDDLTSLVEGTDVALDRLRNIVQGLRRSPLGPRGLGPALGSLASELQDLGNCRITTAIGDLGELPDDRQLVIYQVTREALTNAVRHSKAKSVELSLRREAGGIVLCVRDDGVGFDTEAARTDHFGLLIMQERAASADGSVFTDSTLGGGTTVRAYFPVP